MMALGLPTLPHSTEPLPKPNVLGGLALQQILPSEMAFLVPSLSIPPEPEVEDDDLLANIDFVLKEFTGKDPFSPPPAPIVTSEMIQPALQSTNHLLNALGRAQVEMATASVAVHRVHQGAPILTILEHCDDMLRKIARRAIKAGKQLESTVNQRLFSHKEQLEQAIADIIECHRNLTALKEWALMTFASGVQATSHSTDRS